MECRIMNKDSGINSYHFFIKRPNNGEIFRIKIVHSQVAVNLRRQILN